MEHEGSAMRTGGRVLGVWKVAADSLELWGGVVDSDSYMKRKKEKKKHGLLAAGGAAGWKERGPGVKKRDFLSLI